MLSHSIFNFHLCVVVHCVVLMFVYRQSLGCSYCSTSKNWILGVSFFNCITKAFLCRCCIAGVVVWSLGEAARASCWLSTHSVYAVVLQALAVVYLEEFQPAENGRRNCHHWGQELRFYSTVGASDSSSKDVYWKKWCVALRTKDIFAKQALSKSVKAV